MKDDARLTEVYERVEEAIDAGCARQLSALAVPFWAAFCVSLDKGQIAQLRAAVTPTQYTAFLGSYCLGVGFARGAWERFDEDAYMEATRPLAEALGAQEAAP
jgi:hypothetical protein